MSAARYFSLDHWRGLACLAVAAFHATYYVHGDFGRSATDSVLWLTTGGWVGVPVFFVISGYCIAASADAHRRKGRPAAEYFAKRFRRIFPPFLAALALSVAVVAAVETWLLPGLFCDEQYALHQPGSLGVLQWLGNVTLTEEWRWHLTPTEPRWFLAQAWTLAYEEQFYAVVGLILLFSGRRFFPAVAAVTAAEVALRLTLGHLGLAKSIEGFWFDGRWEMFAAGVLVYYATVKAAGRERLVCYSALAAGAALSIDPGDLIREQSVAWGFAVLIALLKPFDARIAASRPLKPLGACGAMCYSVYLMHWPLVKGVSHGLHMAGVTGVTGTLFVTLPLCMAGTVSLGWAFHVAVERRFMSLPPARTIEDARPAPEVGRLAVLAESR